MQKRLSADDRREAIIQAAIKEFASRGLHGGSTERIAKSVGISQPYIFRLFETKNALFTSVLDHVLDRMVKTFEAAAASDPENPLFAMANSFEKLLEDRDELRVLLQGFAIAAEPEFNEHMLANFARLGETVELLTNAPPEVIKQFFAYGMLHIVSAAIGKKLDFECDGPSFEACSYKV